MREPGENQIKAWSRDYEETPFFFEQKSKTGPRLIAWAEDPTLTKGVFYKILDAFPQEIEILLKIEFREPNSKPLWSRYYKLVEKSLLIDEIRKNETYVFSDGSHQLCVKDPNTSRYLAFDEHGIFFLYSPTAEDVRVFRSLGFEPRYAEPIFSKPHFQHTPPEAEKLEMKFVTALRLEKANSDIE